jgi:uncharacterized membrane protein
MNQLLKWFRPSTPSTSRRARQPRPTRLLVEQLESRDLLSVTYHSGPLLHNVEVETVYYGSAWTSDPALRQLGQQVDDYFRYVTNSPYMDLLDQYGVGRGSFLDHDLSGIGQTTGRVSDTQLRSFLDGEIASGRLQAPNANRLYTIFTPPNVAVTLGTQDSQHDFYGYHNTFTDRSGHTIYYAVMAHPTGNADVPGLDVFRQETDVASHELAEGVTDPNVGGGWWDNRTGYEIGDFCGATHYGVLNGYTVQSEWSNRDNDCVLAQVELYTLQADHTLWYRDLYGNWNQVAVGVRSYALNPDDSVFYLTSVLISHNVQSFAAASDGTMYFLKGDGQLILRPVGGGAVPVASNVTAFTLSPNGVYLFWIETSGALRQEANGQVTTWSTEARSYTLSPDGVYLFWLETSGLLKQEAYGQVTTISSNVTGFTLSPDGVYLYWLEASGDLKQEAYGQYSTISSNVTAFTLSPNGVYLFWIETSGALRQEANGQVTTWSTDARSYTLSPDGVYLYWLETSGLLKQEAYGQVTTISSNVTAFTLSPDGVYLYWLEASGDLKQEAYGQYSTISSNVTAFILSPNGSTLYFLTTNADLYQFVAGNLTLFDSNVQAFLLGPGGFTVDVLETNGDLWQYNTSGRTLMHQDIVSIWLGNGGFALFAQDSDGNVWQFPA